MCDAVTETYPQTPRPKGIAKNILEIDDPSVSAALKSATLIVDATTTLEAPRELSQRDDICRTGSVFLTPSGRSCILLLEDTARMTRLDSLEAQYYSAILESAWGELHLMGHVGHMFVGGGCRDVTTTLSGEDVQLHAAILGKQLRLLEGQPNAQIRVWTADSTSGAVVVTNVPVYPSTRTKHGRWKVIVHKGLETKLGALRQEQLPSETGGVLLGYVDHQLMAIYVVGALDAPSDSQGDETGFTRGVQGLQDRLENVANRTAHMAGYIGEWHSHPPFCAATPSKDDRALLKTLAETLANDGNPAIMVIIGAAGDLTIEVQDAITVAGSEGRDAGQALSGARAEPT